MPKPPLKNLTLILSILACSTPAFAKEPEGTLYQFQLGDKIHGLLSIKPEKEGETGSVNYDAGGDGEITLTGQTQANGQFEWKESLWTRTNEISSTTGQFKGTLAPDHKTGLGQWISGDGKTQYPLTLKRVAGFTTLNEAKLNAEITYPRFESPAYQSLNTQLEKYAKQQFAKNRKIAKEFREGLDTTDPERLQHIAASTTCNVEGLGQTAASLLCSNYEFAGGAHGNTDFTALNYSIASNGTAAKLGLWDILKPSASNQQELSRLIIADLKRQKASSVLDGSISNFTDSLKKNQIPYTLSPKGLAFHFGPYAVGSYAEGYFKVIIPVQKLKPMLNHNWPAF